jgi:Cys-tRNA(Pro)/Cys-tRNA(Cys) deacylase
MKTNAVRLLDALKIAYELREYEVDADDLAAESVAEKIGMPAEQVFKTLVARGDRNGVCFAVIPGNYELDLKALAAAAGDRKIQLVPLKEVQPLTGYISRWGDGVGRQAGVPCFSRRDGGDFRPHLDFSGCPRNPDHDFAGGLHSRRRCQGRGDCGGEIVTRVPPPPVE